jgi:non-heme Fe2+,alpha-ketoglutarate-dependent halogenase
MSFTETYARDGIVFPAGRIPDDGLLERYHAFQAASNRVRGKDTYLKPHLVSPWIWDLARDPVILEKVTALIGPDVILWTADWNVKRAGTGDWVPWHQDSPYWNLSTDDVVSVWIAFGDVTVENGAMQVVPGSHAQGRLGEIDADGAVSKAYAEGQRTTDENCLFPFAHLSESYDEAAVSVVLDSGAFSIHSINLIHGGGPNPADVDRVGLGYRYISADTRYLGEVDSVTAICGDCARDWFVYEPEPDAEFSPASVAALETALAYPSGFGEAKRIR